MATIRITLTLALALTTMFAPPAWGQQSAPAGEPGVRHALGAQVSPVIAIRGSTMPRFARGSSATTTSVVRVGSNAAHDVLVRLEGASDGSSVFVRDANGVFQRVDARRPVVVAVDVPAGVNEIRLAWRAESVGASGAAPAISYSFVPSATRFTNADEN